MRGNNDDASWWQDSLQGYIELPRGLGFEALRDAEFHKAVELKTMFPRWDFKGKETLGVRETYVLQATAGSPVKYYFDVETGLLLASLDGQKLYSHLGWSAVCHVLMLSASDEGSDLSVG